MHDCDAVGVSVVVPDPVDDCDIERVPLSEALADSLAVSLGVDVAEDVSVTLCDGDTLIDEVVLWVAPCEREPLCDALRVCVAVWDWDPEMDGVADGVLVAFWVLV